jgi:hypothetical protein
LFEEVVVKSGEVVEELISSEGVQGVQKRQEVNLLIELPRFIGLPRTVTSNAVIDDTEIFSVSHTYDGETLAQEADVQDLGTLKIDAVHSDSELSLRGSCASSTTPAMLALGARPTGASRRTARRTLEALFPSRRRVSGGSRLSARGQAPGSFSTRP